MSVTTTQGSSSVKLLNRSCNAENSIICRGTGAFVTKRQSNNPFQIGDELMIVGYATYPGLSFSSIPVLQPLATSEDFTLIFDSITEGALHGLFSVGVRKKVLFSRGTLQWSAADSHFVADERTVPGIWRFAPNQWDTIGSANSNIDTFYTGWIELFGWGTSGYNDPTDQYNTNYQPYSSGRIIVNTTTNAYGYGPSTDMASPDLTGVNAYYDWGIYNAISNGGNQPGLWRTLTKPEWDTLINIRATASGIRYAKATVNGVKGLIIVPDNYSASTYALNSANTTAADFTSNVTTPDQWTLLENAGCVFLPVTGRRFGYSIVGAGVSGDYWSATHYDRSNAYKLLFMSGSLGTHWFDYRFSGHLVRLVHDVP